MHTVLWAFAVFLGSAACETGVISPLVQQCSDSLLAVLCVNKYASVMPYHFFRNVSQGITDYPFGSTSVPNDTSFGLVKQFDFLVFDRKRGLGLLGPNPTYEYVFNVPFAVHEAPVYAPVQNKLFFSQLGPVGFLPQYVIDLNHDSLILSEFLSDPPVYAANGGTFHNGLIYWGAAGASNNIGGREQRQGIQSLDPATNKTTTLLNNYFGYYFNSIDDIFVHPNGDIWFTDPDTAPQLETAVYRFRPSTGAVNLVEDTLIQPNGIAISPDLRTVYISDTGAFDGPIVASVGPQGFGFNTTGKRTVYAYDLSSDATHIGNKRPIYLAQDAVPDGLKVAKNGYVVTAAGQGVDVLDATGTLLVRVQTNYSVNNFAWTGPDLKTLWLTGIGGVSKVEWDLQGQDLGKRGY